MRFISLFSGIGGFDLGFENAGMSCALQVEQDKFANQVLEKHWPNVARMEDVHDLNKRNAPDADLVCGGFPCQDLSVAGRRAGLAGERSGLWWEFARIIGDLRPRWVVIENVPGLLSSNKGRDMGILTGKLAELGYWWAYRVLDSQYFGVAQRRRRVFIIANLGNPTHPAKVLFEPESGERHTAPSREKGQGYSSVAGTLAANGGGLDRPAGNANELDFAIPEVARAITTGEVLRQKVDQDNYFPVAYPMKIDQQGSNGPDYKNEGEASFTLNGGPGAAVGVWDRAQITSKENRSQPNPEFSHTLNKDSQMLVGVRRLTPTECERLQGFPDGHTAEGSESPISDTQRYRQLGNAVSVPVAYWIGKRIVDVETTS